MRFRFMSIALVISVALISMSAIAGLSTKQGAKPNSHAATALLKAAREAMGGEAKLAGVKSLLFKGEQRGRNEWYGQVPGANQEWIVRSLEMRVAFPDHFVRILGPAFAGGKPVQYGFSGTGPVPTPEVGKTPSATWPQTLDIQRAEFGRLILIMLLRTDGAITATLRSGTESTLEFSGLGSFPVFLDLDKVTHLPSRLRYQIEMRTAGGPTGEISSQFLSVDDWREISGLRLPHHLTLTRDDGKIYDDYRFKTIQVNPLLTAADFR